MKCFKSTVNVVSAIAAFIAAILWYKASTVIVRPTNRDNGAEFSNAQITVIDDKLGHFDPFETGIAQSKWNKYAAMAASAAAFLQGVGLLIPE